MTAVFWVAVALMTLFALALLAVPLWREARRGGQRLPVSALASLALAPLAIGLYLHVSTWDAEDAATSAVIAEEFALIEQLAARLSTNPDDVNGWRLLGRSYLEIGQYDRARMALEQAWNRTPQPDDELKLRYAEALLYTDETTVHGLAGELVDEVVASSPGNQRALWWGGLIAVERNQPALAIERWSALLATNPPPEIASLIREQLGLMSAAGGAAAGRTDPAAAAAAAPGGAGAQGAVADSGESITLDIGIGADISLDGVGPGAVLYIAARSPTGGPPLAVERHPVSAAPGRFVLSEADAMAAGMPTLAGQTTVSVVARISQGGGAIEQPGDYYGELEVSLPAPEPLRLTIDRTVPQ